MSKTKELKATTELVKQLLEKIPATRDNDDYLYYKVCEARNKSCLHLPFSMVIMNRKQYKLPAFESVRRTRQKLQEHNPELAACDTVEGFRIINEQEFREYARKAEV